MSAGGSRSCRRYPYPGGALRSWIERSAATNVSVPNGRNAGMGTAAGSDDDILADFYVPVPQEDTRTPPDMQCWAYNGSKRRSCYRYRERSRFPVTVPGRAYSPCAWPAVTSRGPVTVTGNEPMLPTVVPVEASVAFTTCVSSHILRDIFIYFESS